MKETVNTKYLSQETTDKCCQGTCRGTFLHRSVNESATETVSCCVKECNTFASTEVIVNQANQPGGHIGTKFVDPHQTASKTVKDTDSFENTTTSVGDYSGFSIRQKSFEVEVTKNLAESAHQHVCVGPIKTYSDISTKAVDDVFGSSKIEATVCCGVQSHKVVTKGHEESKVEKFDVTCFAPATGSEAFTFGGVIEVEDMSVAICFDVPCGIALIHQCARIEEGAGDGTKDATVAAAQFGAEPGDEQAPDHDFVVVADSRVVSKEPLDTRPEGYLIDHQIVVDSHNTAIDGTVTSKAGLVSIHGSCEVSPLSSTTEKESAFEEKCVSPTEMSDVATSVLFVNREKYHYGDEKYSVQRCKHSHLDCVCHHTGQFEAAVVTNKSPDNSCEHFTLTNTSYQHTFTSHVKTCEGKSKSDLCESVTDGTAQPTSDHESVARPPNDLNFFPT